MSHVVYSIVVYIVATIVAVTELTKSGAVYLQGEEPGSTAASGAGDRILHRPAPGESHEDYQGDVTCKLISSTVHSLLCVLLDVASYSNERSDVIDVNGCCTGAHPYSAVHPPHHSGAAGHRDLRCGHHHPNRQETALECALLMHWKFIKKYFLYYYYYYN